MTNMGVPGIRKSTAKGMPAVCIYIDTFYIFPVQLNPTSKRIDRAGNPDRDPSQADQRTGDGSIGVDVIAGTGC